MHAIWTFLSDQFSRLNWLWNIYWLYSILYFTITISPLFDNPTSPCEVLTFFKLSPRTHLNSGILTTLNLLHQLYHRQNCPATPLWQFRLISHYLWLNFFSSFFFFYTLCTENCVRCWNDLLNCDFVHYKFLRFLGPPFVRLIFSRKGKLVKARNNDREGLMSVLPLLLLILWCGSAITAATATAGTTLWPALLHSSWGCVAIEPKLIRWEMEENCLSHRF